MRKHLVTFASKEYYNSANLLRRSALDNGFDEVHIYTENDIVEYMDKNPNLFKHKRGFGLWCWKPYIISDILEKTTEGDLIFYLDSAIIIEKNMEPVFKLIESKKNMFFYVGGFRTGDFRTKTWTKKAVFDFMSIGQSDNILNKPQILGGIHGHINNEKTRKLIKEWNRLCLHEDLMTFDLGIGETDVKEHRQDQSILSILVHLNTLAISIDISQFGKDDSKSHKQFLNLHRKCIQSPSLGIITATTGSDLLEENIKSIQKQTYFNTKHYIVIDGKEYREKAMIIINKFKNKMPIKVVQLPENIGKNGYYGHRPFAAMPFLMDTDYVSCLDEDDTIEDKYAMTVLSNLTKSKKKYGYCLRNIIDKNGDKICKDLCENLGHYINVENTKLVGTSTHFMTRELAMSLSYNWMKPMNYNGTIIGNGQWGADRVYFDELCKLNLEYDYIPKCLVNYRVENTENSVKADFFINGNKRYMFNKLNENGIYLFHFNGEASKILFDNIENLAERAYDNWQLTMPDILKRSIKIQNGFEKKSEIPPGSIVVFNICHPNDIENNLDVFEREDIYKIAYTVESPNIRHQQQWDHKYLFSRFDYVMTYWEPLLTTFKNAVYCPFIHRLSFKNEQDDVSLLVNDKVDKKIIMILEKREFNSEYKINGIKLQSQDYLRELYVDALDNITVYGESWANYHNQDKVNILPSRFKQPESIVKYLKDYTFNLIIENTDAKGYVSEKFYDALVAGCIPIYINKGNINDRLSIPKDCYIDGGNMTPEELNKLINAMSNDEINKYKENIVKKRRDILESVGPCAYDKAVKSVIQLIAS